MLFYPEYGYVAIFHVKSFHAFEYHLPVMQSKYGGRKRYFPERFNTCIVPFSIRIIGNKHVVGNNLSKFKITKIYFLYAAFRGLIDFYGFCGYHIARIAIFLYIIVSYSPDYFVGRVSAYNTEGFYLPIFLLYLPH